MTVTKKVVARKSGEQEHRSHEPLGGGHELFKSVAASFTVSVTMDLVEVAAVCALVLKKVMIY